MYNVIREIIFYVIFLWALMVVSYGFRDPNSYHMKVSLDAQFTRATPQPGHTVHNVDFTQVGLSLFSTLPSHKLMTFYLTSWFSFV